MTINYHFSVLRKLCPFHCQCIQVQKAAAKHQNFLISCQYYRVVIQRTSYMPDLIQAIHSVSCSYDYVWQSVITLSIQVTTTRGIGHCSPPSRRQLLHVTTTISLINLSVVAQKIIPPLHVVQLCMNMKVHCYHFSWIAVWWQDLPRQLYQ